jgi:hypothetical protein
MTKHFHECLCGVEFPCVINILPIEGGRIRCERVYESVCPTCFDSMLHHATAEDLESPILERPKTRNAYRVLELPAPLVAELKRWKIACPPNPNEFVFVNELGHPTGRKENNDQLKACCERAGVKPLSMNNLRHSFASQQLIHGTTPLEVSYLMGHSSPAVTLSIYSHWAKGEKSRAQERLASRIMEAAEEASEEASTQNV